jgi:hypothetical protein
LFVRLLPAEFLVPGRPASTRHGGAILARHHAKAERKEHPVRRLLDLLVWTAVIAVTIAVIMFGTPSPKLNAEPIPGFMTGPTAEDVIRACGVDPALVME